MHGVLGLISLIVDVGKLHNCDGDLNVIKLLEGNPHH